MLVRYAGDAQRARDEYEKRPGSNLRFLLRKRFSWMQRYLGPQTYAVEIGCGAGFSELFLRAGTLELTELEPDCWYHYQFYYYGNSPDDPDKELITTIGVKSLITRPNDDTETLPLGIHMIHGYAWSGAAWWRPRRRSWPRKHEPLLHPPRLGGKAHLARRGHRLAGACT